MMRYQIGKAITCILLLTLAFNPLSLVADEVKQATLLPDVTPSDLPRWRGFNLLEKFHAQWNNRPFLEDDFRWIHELGFNFVRLPMDYRTWIKGSDWNQFDEARLQEIDQAVRWGQQYSIHVCLNFHRAPGYTVASPAETSDLWTDSEAQEVCAKHWAMFARRYRGIPSRQLSFNLFNEPSDVPAEVYVAVVAKMAAAIRSEDPDRLIIADGLQYARTPVPALAKLSIAQATRGYTPMDVTHYRANWVGASDSFAEPTWPRAVAYGSLYSASKPGLSPEATRPIVISGGFERATPMRIRVAVVSSRAKLVATADGEPFWERLFVPGPGSGEWKESRYREQWQTYQNVYDRDYDFTIPAGTRQVELSVVEGDWLSLSEIVLQRPDGTEDRMTLRSGWNEPTAQVVYHPEKVGAVFESQGMEDREWLWRTSVLPWRDAESAGVGVMVGEFGCYNKTPHDVVLVWMEDCLANWQQADWGWALWNFRGSFGILDSGREDVNYEDFHGHKLDRKMLELLQRY